MADKPDAMVGSVPDTIRPEENTRAHVVRDAPEPDIFHVDKKKQGYEYRFLNKNSANINRKMMVEGYEIVQGSDPEVAGVKQPDGTRAVGDTVLGRRPIEVGDKRRERRRALQEKIEGSSTQTFHEAGEAANREAREAGYGGPGVTTFETDGEGNENRPVIKPHRKTWPGAQFDKSGNLLK